MKNDGSNRDEVIDEYVKRLDREIKLLRIVRTFIFITLSYKQR